MAELQTMEIPAGPSVMEDGKPFFFEGGRTGVLLQHGFTGTTSSMKPMGEYLAGRGLTVLGPRLPGHGTDVKDMGRYSYNDWIATVETALAELQGICDKVFVAGLSMGGTLTLYMGEQHSDTLAGIIPIDAAVVGLASPSQDRQVKLVPIMKHLIKTLPGAGGDVKDPDTTEIAYKKVSASALHEFLKLMKYVESNIGRITVPIRIFHAREDHVIAPRNAIFIYEQVRSSDKELIWLDNSYHVATIDLDQEKVFEDSYNFIKSVAG